MRIAGAYAVEGTLAVYCARVHCDVIVISGSNILRVTKRVYCVCWRGAKHRWQSWSLNQCVLDVPL